MFAGLNGPRGPFSLANVLFSVCNTLNDHCSANGHVPLIYADSSLIAHSLGDIQYFCVIKKILWAPPSLFAIAKHSDLSLASVQQTFAANSCLVEQTFNKTLAVLNGPTDHASLPRKRPRCPEWRSLTTKPNWISMEEYFLSKSRISREKNKVQNTCK